jgi:uncharacterized protein
MSDHTLPNPPSAESVPAHAGLRDLVARAAAFARTEYGIVVAALGLIGLHVVDDNYLQPEPGTSPGDHLASGLVPLAILGAAAALYPHLRAGLRATVAMTFGAIGLAFGFPGAYYVLDGNASGDHYTGLFSIAAGLVLLGSGPVLLWKARRSGGSRRRRYARRSLNAVVAAVAALGIIILVVFPVAYSYGYTHTGRTAEAPKLGMPYESVTVTTSDGLDLSASYVPSKNRAAVVVFPGLSAVKEARIMARHGYGVLLLDPRGQGSSEGDISRWAGDRDLLAGAKYLQSRPDVDPDRIGGFGSSVGGEILLEAAAKSTAFKAVVSEGAGLRLGERSGGIVTGPARLLWDPAMVVMTGATSVFSNHGPPPPIADRIGRIAPRAVFLIYADPGMGGEAQRQRDYYAAAGDPKAIWKVPGATHTNGIDAHPVEYERRVIAFLDSALR